MLCLCVCVCMYVLINPKGKNKEKTAETNICEVFHLLLLSLHNVYSGEEYTRFCIQKRDTKATFTKFLNKSYSQEVTSECLVKVSFILKRCFETLTRLWMESSQKFGSKETILCNDEPWGCSRGPGDTKGSKFSLKRVIKSKYSWTGALSQKEGFSS